MELAIIIYLIEFLDKIDRVALMLGIFLSACAFLVGFVSCVEDENYFSDIPKAALGYIKIAFCIIAIALILPSEKTAYKMLAAYAGTELIQMEQTKEIGGKAYKALNKVLDDYLLEEVAK